MSYIRPVIKLMQWLGKAPYVSYLRESQVREEVVAAGFENVEHWTHGKGNTLFLISRKLK